MNGRVSKKIARMAASLERSGHYPPKGTWRKILKKKWRETPHNEKHLLELEFLRNPGK